MSRVAWGLAVVVVAGTIWVIRPGASSPAIVGLPEEVDFNFHIRPILSDNCYVCHGPDASTREAGLRLDTYAGATEEREEGAPAIVPGRAGRSLLLQRVTATDPAERMPPAEMKKVLSPYEVALIDRWIEQGAVYKKHWSLIPPTASEQPERQQATAIDQFIADGLHQQGLSLAAPAPRAALLRRLSFALTGLPPTPEAIRAFSADESSEAYAQWVDRYLQSPHFGERWARHWMDLVRYADSKGHEFDFNIEGAWRYRDYLIRAFNADVPYDQLLTEHLAGDLIKDPRRHTEEGYNESVIGTTFLSLGEGTHSPVDVRQDEADRIDNIIDVTTKTFQGLTVSCARCHDHKFDPIPTRDYYALFGIFESTRFTPTALLSARHEARIDTLHMLQAQMRATLATQWLAEAKDDTESEETQLSAVQANYRILGDFRDASRGDWQIHGPAFEQPAGPGDLRLDRTRRVVTGLHTGTASSTRWPEGLPGAFRSPTFVIEHDTIAVMAAGRNATIRVVVDNFQLIRGPIYDRLETELHHADLRTYRFDATPWQGRKAYVEVLQGVYKRGRSINEHHLLQLPEDTYAEITGAVAYTGTLPDLMAALPPLPVMSTTLSGVLRAWQEGTASGTDLTRINAALSQGLLSSSTTPIAPLIQQVEQLISQQEAVVFAQTVIEGDHIESPVFVRGKYKNLSSDPVPHRFLSAVMGDSASFTRTNSGRLELAEAIANPANPLTARVMVNRLWHHLFGRGLVETVDNFGAQGKLPTHPALLDYLAVRFVEEGWSIKAIIREMVLTEVFQQATHPDSTALAVDPLNLLWHHYPVRRLEGEAIRDAVLAASGRLDPALYGPPVPVRLTPFMTGRGRPPETGPLDGAGRRTIYTAIRRNFLSPMMLAFDMPIPFSTFGKRNASNVPAQSLTLLNDPFIAEQAANWGAALAQMPGDRAHKIDQLYLAALSRLPTEAERADAEQFIEAQIQQLARDGQMGHQDPRPWTAYCHVVFNLKEFIYLI